MHEHSFWICIWTLAASAGIALMFTVFSCHKIDTEAELELARQGRTAAEIYCILDGSPRGEGGGADALYCRDLMDKEVSDDSNS